MLAARMLSFHIFNFQWLSASDLGAPPKKVIERKVMCLWVRCPPAYTHSELATLDLRGVPACVIEEALQDHGPAPSSQAVRMGVLPFRGELVVFIHGQGSAQSWVSQDEDFGWLRGNVLDRLGVWAWWCLCFGFTEAPQCNVLEMLLGKWSKVSATVLWPVP